MELTKQKVLVPNIFQVEALKKLEETKENKGVVIMPCGVGKTFLSALWFKKQLEKNPKAKLLFVCHNRDILSQANELEFKRCLKDFNIPFGYYIAREKDVKQVTFATTQTLGRNLSKFEPSYFDYIIADECHRDRARTYEKVIKYFTPKFMLGLTATPNRLDGLSIFKLLGKKIYEANITDAIKKDLLTKINYYCVDNDIDFSKIKYNGGKYDEKDLNRKICIKKYDITILEEYKKTIKRYNKKKTICFCATTEHTHRMAKVFSDNGIKAIGLTARNRIKKDLYTRQERKEIINDFRNGKYEVICVRDLFNEGIDIPNADAIILLRSTLSHTIFTQQIGRGMRKAEGKEDVLILDFTGNANKCHINFEVLSEIFEEDIIKKVKNTKRIENLSEIIIIKNGCKVRLSKTKINILKYSGFGKDKYTKEMLIEIYQGLRNKLNRPVSATDLHKYLSLDYMTFARHFGSWNKFKQLMNDQKIIPKERVIKQFKEFYEKNKYYPNVREIRKNHLICDNTIRKLWGSYGNFIEELGGKPNKYLGEMTKEKLINDYLEVKKKLNRVPFSYEMNKHLNYCFNSGIFKVFKKKGEYGMFLKEVIGQKDYEEWHNNNRALDNIRTKTIMNNLPRKYTKEQVIKDYIIVYNKLNRHPSYEEIRKRLFKGIPTMTQFTRILGLKNASKEERERYFDDLMNKNSNIQIVSNYKPKILIPKQPRINHHNVTSYSRTSLNMGFHSKSDKLEIRNKIIANIKDGDNVLLLESPELLAIKEIEKQNIKPNKIIIPNHLEFQKIVKALENYKTNLNIELIKTSALQYLADTEIKFDFIWLDYCGAFSYYIKDLDVLFQKHFQEMKLILTYNIFDPLKSDDNYYFTRVIDYVLDKVSGDNHIRLLNDVTYRYKKNMYNLGFEIKPQTRKNEGI